MPDRITMWVASIEPGDGRATIRGEVWLGPVAPGDLFTAATTADAEQPVRLRVEDIEAPRDAQEAGRVPRVVAVLVGDGVDALREGVVLVGPVPPG